MRPSRNAWATLKRRSGTGSESFASMAFLSGFNSILSERGISSKPVNPVSIEFRAFCSDSKNVLPIAIASPTDFIDVVSVASAPANFSKVNRGILVTT